ncbi:DUF3857 domain-containing protein [Aequorivita viscosa]|uniref:Transglutaminase-like enzyme, putative cysteine protease n=1 Tax=Aequorivita viscosa TaxID=797419 RepID=A0A1M6CQG3_9FLAO|nr:DUF3857 domain-containing protein [Aequorivita viscosa]SDW39397.1 Transglutaminase-like enzyme, putative cysteine protease [Aequorivita viscosa]SHI63034.1 Transglutaminase-like enzyme, putative cysteine protease [Aequorivita viscosa]
MKTKITLTLLFLSIFSFSVAQDFRFGKVSEEELLQKEHPIDPTANAAILYRETKTEFQYSQGSGWYMVTDYFERVKIYNKEGFDWANISIDLYKGSSEDKLIGLRGYTYFLNAKGKVDKEKLGKDGIFDQETSKYLTQTKITMPDVKEGSVIEYKYTIESPFIYNIDEFRLQEEIPLDKVSVVFKSPEYFQYKTHQRGWIPYQVNSTVKDRSMSISITERDNARLSEMKSKTRIQQVKFKENAYEIEMESVPAMKKEPFAGNINNYTTALQFEMSYQDFNGSSIKTYSTTWEAVSKSIYDIEAFGQELNRRNYFEKDIDALLEGVSKPEEKAARIFLYVLTKMNWNGYYGYFSNDGVKAAYKRGSGNVADINLMLTAMLRYANLEANPVLVSTKSHGIPLFPTRNGFNYVITAVELPQGVILLDATNKDAEVGVLKSDIINGDGRLIKEGGISSWISLRSLVPAVKSSMLSMEIQPDLSVTGKSRNRYTGNYAFQYRTRYKNLSKEAQLKSLEKNLNQTELSAVEFENLNKLGQPVSLQYDFETLEGIEDVAGKLYFSPMLFLATEENPFKSETREYPIDFGFPMKDRYILNIALPEGYQVESLPENIVYDLGQNIGGYKYLISQMGNNLQLSVELSIDQSFISPEEYGNLKKFFELLVSKEKEKVVLIKA